MTIRSSIGRCGDMERKRSETAASCDLQMGLWNMTRDFMCKTTIIRYEIIVYSIKYRCKRSTMQGHISMGYAPLNSRMIRLATRSVHQHASYPHFQQWSLHHTELKTFLSPSSKPTVKSKTRSVGPGRYFSIFLTKDQRWGQIYVLRQNIRALLSTNHTNVSQSFFNLDNCPVLVFIGLLLHLCLGRHFRFYLTVKYINT